jgi:hypothetical protein
MKRDFDVISILFLITLFLSACRPDVQRTLETAVLSEPTTAILSGTPDLPTGETTQIYTTQNNLLGNHLVEGSIDLHNASITDIPLDGTPLWLASAPFEEGAIFAVVLENGQTQAFLMQGRSYQSYQIAPVQLPAGMPPLLAVSDGNAQLSVPPPDASSLTNPLWVNGRLLYIGANGDLVSSDSIAQTRLPVQALPDARLLLDESNRLLLLTGPTNRYDHGVLGDKMEASAITLVETEPELRVVRNIPIEAPDVVEGISPIWADLDEDGQREIIVTLSNNQSGARIAAFREDGSLLAESPPIGLGQRWRHQIAVARFDPDQQPLIVSIRTPHIGGVVEFFQLISGRLEPVREAGGFSAHTIGSRNLDAAVAGDFNNDGIPKLLAPDQTHTTLGVIAFDGTLTTVSLDGTLTSNLSVTNNDGHLFIGAGTPGNLRVWSP